MNKPEDKKAPLNPYSAMCVITHDGKEVGRVAAAARNAEAYIMELGRRYGSLNIEYVEDSTAAMIDQMIRRPRK